MKIGLECLPESFSVSLKQVLTKTFMCEQEELIKADSKSESATIHIQRNSKSIDIIITPSTIRVEGLHKLTSELNRFNVKWIGGNRIRIYLDESMVDEGPIENAGDVAGLMVSALGQLIGDALTPFFSAGQIAAILVDSRAGIVRTLLKPYVQPMQVSLPDEEYRRLYFILAEKLYNNEIDLEDIQPLCDELGGYVKSVYERGYFTLYFESSFGVKVPFERAPSGFRESLVTALALAAQNYPEVILIEEPEAHLHPRAQRVLTRLMARALNKKRKTIILSTHSDYILSSINNLIAFSEKRDLLSSLGYNEYEVIKPEMVSAYLIKQRNKESVVEKLEINHEGIPEDEFTKVSGEIVDERSEILP